MSANSRNSHDFWCNNLVHQVSDSVMIWQHLSDLQDVHVTSRSSDCQAAQHSGPACCTSSRHTLLRCQKKVVGSVPLDLLVASAISNSQFRTERVVAHVAVWCMRSWLWLT